CFAPMLGWRTPFVILTLLSSACLMTSPWWPSVPATERTVSFRGVNFFGGVCLAGVFLYFVGQGAAWGFIGVLGSIAGEKPESVAHTLSLAVVPGLLASIAALSSARHVSLHAGLLGSLATTLCGLGLLGTGAAGIVFGVGAGLFYFGWCASFPFQFAAV